jgi:hypothetical protein
LYFCVCEYGATLEEKETEVKRQKKKMLSASILLLKTTVILHVKRNVRSLTLGPEKTSGKVFGKKAMHQEPNFWPAV